MEANESSGLTNSYSSSYPSHHHHHHNNHHHNHQSPPQQPPPPSSLAFNEPNQPSGSNGVASADGGGGSALFPPSVAGKAPSVDPQRRKRGRPRKYSTPEAAAAAKRAAVPAAVKRVERQFQAFGGGGGGGGGGGSGGGGFLSSSGSSKKSNFASFGGQGFTPHVINVAAGEDVGQRILLFMQQAKRELCILSASGSIASAALRQPATSGGSIAYQGRFDIVSLTGSYVRSDQGGKAGGLSACLSSENGQIVGGGVCGPLIAAGPVEVIIATFQVDPKKDITVGFKGDISGSTIPSPVSASPATYRPLADSCGGGYPVTSNDDHQNIDGNAFMMQSQWRSGLNYDFAGQGGQNSHDSPENGDYEQIRD